MGIPVRSVIRLEIKIKPITTITKCPKSHMCLIVSFIFKTLTRLATSLAREKEVILIQRMYYYINILFYYAKCNWVR